MSNLDNRVLNVIKKSSLFSLVQSLSEEDIITNLAIKVEDILSKSDKSFNDKQDDLSDFILDYLESYNIEIDTNEADAIANILVWIYEENKMQQNEMYNKIMQIKSPEPAQQEISDYESEIVDH
ncbi:hypothetical protein AAJ76_1000114274 [Vairimorpha ceranae]|uniref:Uncharacterized protein n=1 Tax=Vairimorpha ceranae TaxID=40302 RepID=A0A0F9WVB2_9MICR|nr:hypothetical protein AAJ76_1000114274 [Vairimorpha ceranae]KAF5141676.1 hypothetical protein G9O61_00g002180 [Vairimorpha ceranae]KKO76673.1 hypothetical protein AAJ76_1000114274 [Vairimorpha ceranae]